MNKQQVAKCRELEIAYRNVSSPPKDRGDDVGALEAEYVQKRDELAQDPVAVAWVVRMFVRDVISVREGRALDGEAELLRAAAGFDNPVEARAVAQLQELGVRAVPTLVGDLLQNSQPHNRELGVELLAHVGEAAIPAVQDVARTGPAKNRRAAARALGHIGATGEVLQTLRTMAADGDFTIRADALRSLHSGGAEARALLMDRMVADEDPFVRKVAAQTLARFRDPVAAQALVDLLERSKASGDMDNELVAQKCLMEMSGRRRPRSVAAWRTFVLRLEDEKQ